MEANGTIVAVVPISRQADRAGDVSDTLKTPGSSRVVAIPEPWSLDVLDAARANQPGGWLTPDGVGGPLSQFTFNAAWRRALKAPGYRPSHYATCATRGEPSADGNSGYRKTCLRR